MSKKPVGVSQAFRAWTRGVSFTLAMGKCQVAVLVAVHASKGLRFTIGRGHRALSHWITGSRCLQDRGLLIHHDLATTDPVRWRTHQHTTEDIWEITEAGKHVVELLKIAGVYDELVEEFRAADRDEMRRLA